MGAISGRRSTRQGIATVGRLGGLSSIEADWGERSLWLAGDGYRAALFHLGALTRLNELGLLAQVNTVGAVSGGSILAALLATKVRWPLRGVYREWSEQVAQPLREISRRDVHPRSAFRKPFPGEAAEAALEESYARDLVESLGGESGPGPSFVFGASGLTLSGIAAGWEQCVEWELAGAAHPPGYDPSLVAEVIVAMRTDLEAFEGAEQAVLENHGYLLADAALQERGLGDVDGTSHPPHPDWMDAERVRRVLSTAGRQRGIKLGPWWSRRGRRVRERAG